MVGAQLSLPAAVNVTSLSVAYATKKRRVDALVDVSIEAGPGEFVALRGHSGSGKTTLLFALAGLLRAPAGAVALDGKDVGAMTEEAAADFRLNRIGFVFQFFHLLPFLTALDNVALPLRLRGLPHSDARNRAMAQLRNLGLSERATHLPRELSGGEQQRVAVARAVISQPSLILADEPTGNLDSRAAVVVADLLVEVAHGTSTLIVATHDERLLERADRVYTLDGGRLTGHDGGKPTGTSEHSLE